MILCEINGKALLGTVYMYDLFRYFHHILIEILPLRPLPQLAVTILSAPPQDVLLIYIIEIG